MDESLNRPPLRVVLPTDRYPTLRTNLASFDIPQPPIFAQKYGEGQGFYATTRWVDIGEGHFGQIEHAIALLRGVEGVVVSEPRRSDAIGSIEKYQNIRFGTPQASRGGGVDSYRGLIMIEPENLLSAIVRLNYVGFLRFQEGKYLHYRWAYPMVRNETDNRVPVLKGRKLEALYRANPMNSLIHLFANNQLQMETIFAQLIREARWDEIELSKRAICTIPISTPQKGKVRYNHDRKEYFTLELT